jgi:hypothetical protein
MTATRVAPEALKVVLCFRSELEKRLFPGIENKD